VKENCEKCIGIKKPKFAVKSRIVYCKGKGATIGLGVSLHRTYVGGPCMNACWLAADMRLQLELPP